MTLFHGFQSKEITSLDVPPNMRDCVKASYELFQATPDQVVSRAWVYAHDHSLEIAIEQSDDQQLKRVSHRLSILASNQNIDAIALLTSTISISGDMGDLDTEQANRAIGQASKLGVGDPHKVMEYLISQGLNARMCRCLHLAYETRLDCYSAFMDVDDDEPQWNYLMHDPNAPEQALGKLGGFFLKANYILETAIELQERDAS